MIFLRSLSYVYSKRLNAKPNEIYDVVIDIKNYKKFIPYIVDSFDDLPQGLHQSKLIDSQSTLTDSQQQKTGTGGFTIDWKGYNESINCNLTYKPNTQIISECQVGIFKHLYVEWNFIPVKPAPATAFTKLRNDLIKQGCNVELKLDYEFKNVLYNHLSSLVNSTLGSLMIKAFENELTKRQRSDPTTNGI